MLRRKRKLLAGHYYWITCSDGGNPVRNRKSGDIMTEAIDIPGSTNEYDEVEYDKKRLLLSGLDMEK